MSRTCGIAMNGSWPLAWQESLLLFSISVINTKCPCKSKSCTDFWNMLTQQSIYFGTITRAFDSLQKLQIIPIICSTSSYTLCDSSSLCLFHHLTILIAITAVTRTKNRSHQNQCHQNFHFKWIGQCVLVHAGTLASKLDVGFRLRQVFTRDTETYKFAAWSGNY